MPGAAFYSTSSVASGPGRWGEGGGGQELACSLSVTFQPPWCWASRTVGFRLNALRSCIHYSIVSLCVWGCLRVCVFLFVSACQCQAVCDCLHRPVWAAQCDNELGGGEGGVGRREGISEPQT